MEGSLQDGGSFESNYVDGTTRKEKSGDQNCSSSCSGSSCYRLFGRQRTVHQIMGGGRVAVSESATFQCEMLTKI